MTTVASVAAMACVAIPELPVGVVAPALDARVVLRSAASLTIHTEDGARCLQVFLKAPHYFPDVPGAVLGSFLARATNTAHHSPTAPHLSPMHPWPTPHGAPRDFCPLILRLLHMGAAGRCLSVQGDVSLKEASP